MSMPGIDLCSFSISSNKSTICLLLHSEAETRNLFFFSGQQQPRSNCVTAGATRLAICCWRHLQTAVQSDTFATHLLQTALQSDLSNPPDMSRLGSNLNTCNTAALLTLDSAELYVCLNVIKRCQ